jgi:hypothetical protein
MYVICTSCRPGRGQICPTVPHVRPAHSRKKANKSLF